MPSVAVPGHVPSELVWDNDLPAFSEQFANPYVALSEEFHNGPDIRWVTSMVHNRQGWFLTRHADQAEVFLNPEVFSSRTSADLCDLLGVSWRMIPNETDPPAHLMYRRILQPWFQPSVINKMDQGMRESCRKLLDKFAPRGEGDFCSEFGVLFPSQIFLQLMGMPVELLDQFLVWEHEIMRGETGEVRLGALTAVVDYMSEYMKEKQRNPTEGDLASYIATVRLDGGRLLTEEEIKGITLVLYVGGLDTVASSIGWYLMALARNPELQDQLRQDPSLIPNAVEELLRAYGVTIMIRHVTRDTEFRGLTMRKGDLVTLPQFLASRDPRAFSDPHKIDFTRKARNLTLGTGPHNCLGIHLAKREIRIALEEWLARCKNIRIADEEGIRWQAPGVWGVTQLPLKWDLAA